MENNIWYLIFFVLSIVIASFSQIILKKGAEEKNIYINKYTIVRIFFNDYFYTLHTNWI